MNRLQTEFSTGFCSLFSVCSGCDLRENIGIPPVWKEMKDFFLSNKIDAEFVFKELVRWRSRVKLAVRGTVDSPQIGLFSKGTHDVIDMPSCPMHYEIMDEALRLIREKITQYKIDPYCENGSLGRLRYISMVVNRRTLKIQLSLVFNSSCLKEKELNFIEDIYGSKPYFHSIWANFLSGSTNTIFGKEWKLVIGEKDFYQEVAGIEFCFHPSCFFQAHLTVFEEMLFYIDSLVPDNSQILELYAGVGCIGVYLAQKSSNVILVESSLEAESCFKKTVLKAKNEISSRCRFLTSSVEELFFPEKEIDVLIVDPPRKGLSKKCKEKIYALDPKKIIYVSCGPASFIRDAQEFIGQGWKMEKARGFYLFPGTDHAEIVSSFVKSS